MLSTLKANISTYQTEVGATAADITFINTALANVAYVDDYANDVDAFKKGVFQIKQTAVMERRPKPSGRFRSSRPEPHRQRSSPVISNFC